MTNEPTTVTGWIKLFPPMENAPKTECKFPDMPCSSFAEAFIHLYHHCTNGVTARRWWYGASIAIGGDDIPENPYAAVEYGYNAAKAAFGAQEMPILETLENHAVSYVSISADRLAELEEIEATFNAIDGDKYKQAYIDGKPRIGFVQAHIGYVKELGAKAAKWDTLRASMMDEIQSKWG